MLRCRLLHDGRILGSDRVVTTTHPSGPRLRGSGGNRPGVSRAMRVRGTRFTCLCSEGAAGSCEYRLGHTAANTFADGTKADWAIIRHMTLTADLVQISDERDNFLART